MNYTELNARDFVDVLASKEPVPGGGGASALVGAIGMALGNMVGSLTTGKKKYAAVQDEIADLKQQAERIQTELLDLVQADARAFAPLSKAYGLPGDTEEQRAHKAEVMEACLKEACLVPLQIMEKCCEAVDVTEKFAEKGTRIAVSDAGVSAMMLRAALTGASLNVFINTRSMKDRKLAGILNAKADQMLTDYTRKADQISEKVTNILRDKK